MGFFFAWVLAEIIPDGLLVMHPLEVLGRGRALRTLVPLGRRGLSCGPFYGLLAFPAGAAAWLGAGGEDMGELEEIFSLRILRCPRNDLSGLGNTVGLVDSVVPVMIR